MKLETYCIWKREKTLVSCCSEKFKTTKIKRKKKKKKIMSHTHFVKSLGSQKEANKKCFSFKSLSLYLSLSLSTVYYWLKEAIKQCKLIEWQIGIETLKLNVEQVELSWGQWKWSATKTWNLWSGPSTRSKSGKM